MSGKKLKGMRIAAAAVLTFLVVTVTAYAENMIQSIRVTFTNNYDSTGSSILEPTVNCASGYSVEDVTWSKEADKWKPGSKVTATVTLAPNEGNSFGSKYTSKKASISGADFVSAKRDEDKNLTVKAEYYPVVQLGATEKAGWSDAAKTRAVWKKVPYATAYQLRLYRGNDEHVKTLTLEGTSVDLSEYITKEASYFYEVRATAKDSSDASYMKSGSYVTSEDTFVENLGETEGRWSQTRNGYRYTDADGVEASSGWRYILGYWYYFDENGYAATGWQNINAKWYYMNNDCKMVTGWLNLGDKWYFLDITGAMVTGWYQASPTDWYYFYEDGSMAEDTDIDGYHLAEDGRMQ